MAKRKTRIEPTPAKYDIERNGGVPKLIVLRQERDAAEVAEDAAGAAYRANPSPELEAAFWALVDVTVAAERAINEEMRKADQLRVRFEAAFNDEHQGSGLDNARDTAAEKGWWTAYGLLVEHTTEFWNWALLSAQFAEDCAADHAAV